jgi:hypothetical protein
MASGCRYRKKRRKNAPRKSQVENTPGEQRRSAKTDPFMRPDRDRRAAICLNHERLETPENCLFPEVS